MNRGSLKRYLLYAIGEIMLVVVGILIAIQVNNWNEQNKEVKIEQQYLNRLKGDLLNDLHYFKERRHYADSLLNQYQVYTDNSYTNQSNYDEFSELFCCLDFPPTELNINKTTYLELLSTGKLNSVQNIELRESISNHYQIFEKYNRHLIEFDSFANIALGNMDASVNLTKHLKALENTLPRYKKQMLDNERWQFINNPASPQFLSVENTVATYHHKFKTFLGYLDLIEENTKKLIGSIDKELN